MVDESVLQNCKLCNLPKPFEDLCMYCGRCIDCVSRAGHGKDDDPNVEFSDTLEEA
jgi:hypothetical protein